MKLRELLQGKHEIYVAQYVRTNGVDTFKGGCFYVDDGKNPPRLASLDGKEYSLSQEVLSYEWRENDDLKVWVEK